MKKKIFKLLTGMLLSCALAGSTVAVQAEEAGTDTVKSYLTGEDVSVRHWPQTSHRSYAWQRYQWRSTERN